MNDRILQDRNANPTFDSETYRRLTALKRIGNRAVRRAQEENRKRGIPNVYSIRGHLYYEGPDGILTRDDPFLERKEDGAGGTEGHSDAETKS